MRLTTLLAGLGLCATLAQAQTALTGTVRDLTPANPDFENGCCALVTGLVAPVLAGNSPSLAASWLPGQGFITSAESFAQWWSDDTPSQSHSITLAETAPGSGVFRFESTTFFPIDDALLGNTPGWSHNYHFSFAIHAQFAYLPGSGQVFSFVGDDDVWVYFDKRLGIDLGGVHSPAGGSVNLDTFMAGQPQGQYAFDFFFAERHTSGSTLVIETSLNLTPAVPEPASALLLLAGMAALVWRGRQATHSGQGLGVHA